VISKHVEIKLSQKINDFIGSKIRIEDGTIFLSQPNLNKKVLTGFSKRIKNLKGDETPTRPGVWSQRMRKLSSKIWPLTNEIGWNIKRYCASNYPRDSETRKNVCKNMIDLKKPVLLIGKVEDKKLCICLQQRLNRLHCHI
jgi:hypothetical protein